MALASSYASLVYSLWRRNGNEPINGRRLASDYHNASSGSICWLGELGKENSSSIYKCKDPFFTPARVDVRHLDTRRFGSADVALLRQPQPATFLLTIILAYCRGFITDERPRTNIGGSDPSSIFEISDGQLSSGGLDFTSSGCTLLAQPGVLRFSILITTSQSNAQSSGDGSVLEVAEGAPLVVQCSLRPHQPLSGFSMVQHCRICALPLCNMKTAASDSEVVSRLEWARRRHHAGRYTCTQGSDAPRSCAPPLRSRTRTGTDRRPSYPFGSVS
ncbi:hypothetical protein EVAR_102405_1 [Eumeta japonica]|uniref:Uncharacterized protein n=1 Tax=Eumeta variegata TaxID=151549 RepID=A0A4C2AET1_EUMVA|nr:hypothetical protein EVAR_102405_1 [Eumeta japonica]